MSALSLARIAALVDAPLEAPLEWSDRPVAAAAVDSRLVRDGDLFVAVRGQQVDGHDFIEAAAKQGAAAALVESDSTASIPCLRVDNSLRALTTVATANRDHYDGDVIAITGSNGKTSVKNMCDAIFSAIGPTVATAGNYNNEIGVPLTLARLSDETRHAVVEMGATRRGDVAHLCAITRPTVSTVLNAMEAHLEGFGSIADVASVKAEIFDELGPQGTAVVNQDQSWCELWERRARASGAQIVRWSVEQAADVYATDIEDLGLRGTRFRLHLGAEQRSVALALPGRHNVANAVAAAALAAAAGVTADAIAQGLCAVRAVSGRLQAEDLANGMTLIDDSYNANPGSVRAAIALLAAEAERESVLILGEMLELGADAADRHREMGELARESGIHGFIGVGDALRDAVDAFGVGGRWYAERELLNADLQQALPAGATILVKGSRGSAMESVVAAVRKHGESTPC